jgi:hypothetical protein
MQSFERQMNFIRQQLMIGEYKNAIDSMELLAMYMRFEINEIGKESE